MFAMLMSISIQTNAITNSLPTGIGIDFSTKAYWDGQTKSCLQREKGFCLHISIELNMLPGHIIGSINYSPIDGLIFTFNKKTSVLSETFDELFKGGFFIMDGDGTFSDDLLLKLGLPQGYRIPAGKYPYTENGGIVTVVFK
jgi:hypothetical protein